MNYEKLYFAFIEKYKNQEFEDDVYTEKHHIIPRHAGGDDSKENLIKLTYRQHIFAHRLLWKAYNKASDLKAWLLMSGTEESERIANYKAIGMANVVSGHLDKIRKFANTKERQEKLKELNQHKVSSGLAYVYIAMAQEAWKGSSHTEEFKENRSRLYKERYSSGEDRERILRMQQKANVLKTEKSSQHSQYVIENAERNEEFLHKSSPYSKNLFVSPEGLVFESPVYAANYYGNVKPHVIDNWCKRNHHGWTRKPKPNAAQE